MIVLIEQAALHKALTRIAAVVERRNTIPILGNILITADEDAVRLTATDLEMEAVATVEARVDQPGALTVSATTLSDIVRNAPVGAEISLASDPANAFRVNIAFGRSSYDLATLPAEDFPSRQHQVWNHELQIAALDLHQVFARSVFAATTDETRYFMQGVYLHMVGEHGRPWLRGVGCRTLGIAYGQTPHDGEVFPAVRIPRKAVTEFMRSLDGRAGPVMMRLSTTAALLELGDLSLTTKLMDGAYPDYASNIAETWDIDVEVNRVVLYSAVKRIALLSGEKVRGVKLTLDHETLTVSVRDPAAGFASEQVAVDYVGPLHEIGLNARDLLDGLDQSEAEIVRLQANTPKDPICLRPLDTDPEAGHFLTILARRMVAG